MNWRIYSDVYLCHYFFFSCLCLFFHLSFEEGSALLQKSVESVYFILVRIMPLISEIVILGALLFFSNISIVFYIINYLDRNSQANYAHNIWGNFINYHFFLETTRQWIKMCHVPLCTEKPSHFRKNSLKELCLKVFPGP